MRRPRRFFQLIKWAAVGTVLLAFIAVGTLTNVTLRSVEKNLPGMLLKQLGDVKFIVEGLAEVVFLSRLTRAEPSGDHFDRLRTQVGLVHASIIRLRNTYVFDNMVQASGIHAVVAPAITDANLWLAEGFSGYGPESLTTIQVVESRISEAYEKAKALNQESEVAAQRILTEQRSRLERFLMSVNLLFVVAIVISFLLVVVLTRQHLLGQREVKAQEERRQAEAALTESQERFRELAELLPETIFEIDTQGILTFVNQNASNHFGYSLEEFESGMNGFLMISEEDRPRVMANAKRVLDGERIGLNEYIALRKDGTTFPVVMHSTPKFRDGKPVGIRGIVIDMTETKKLEAQLRQAHKMEAIGTLAGGIAHDFNNLLQAVQGYAELLLLDKRPGDEGVGELEEIRRAARRGAELTRQLLTFSRKVESKLEPVDLNQTVENVRRLLERTIPKMIRIELRLVGNLHHVKADALQIEQVLMNLAVNARDAMPEQGTLTIETANITLDDSHRRNQPEVSPGNYVVLTVTDTGHGMDDATREHIFDPFFTTKEVGKGTGLGLAMVYGIVKNHGGHITCESVAGEGTSFRIYLPAMVVPMETPVTAAADTEQPVGVETILLVDDDNALRELGGRILERYGYTVIRAEDGETALRIYREQKDLIGLVILDLIMPGIGGKHCLQELLKMDPLVKVLIASGHSDSTQVERATEIGAKGYVRKPYDVQQLLRVVREIL